MRFVAGACLLLAGVAAAEPYSIPISTKLVHGDVTLPSGVVIKFTVLEGEMLTVKDGEEGLYLGFTPVIENEAELQVRFNLFEITEVGPGLHSVKQIDSVPVAKAEPGSSVVGVYPQIAVRHISNSSMSAGELEELRAKLAVPANLGPKPGKAQQPEPEPQGTCCVTCGLNSACGCAVQLPPCGSCCTSPCCGGSGGPTQDNRN